MKKPIVMWKNGSRHKIPAEVFYEETEKLRAKHGNLTADYIVDAALEPDNPMAPMFPFDDIEGSARKHWLSLANYATRSLVAIYEEAPTVEAQRVYMSIVEREADEPVRNVYQSTYELMRDPVTRQQVLARAVAEAQAYRKKYAELQELAQLFEAMDEFVARFG